MYRWLALWIFPVFSLFSLDLNRIRFHSLETQPYKWAMIDSLFEPQEAIDLATTYPCDHFKTVNGYDGEKGYLYEVRALISMHEKRIVHPQYLSASWLQLAHDLLSDAYRQSISLLTGIDLSEALMEVNVFHYGPGCWMGPHIDLKDKIVTHVLYFNADWDERNGGHLAILQSKDIHDIIRIIPPLVGNSAIIVRSTNSWHAVAPIARHCRTSRRSVTVTFYHPQSVSTMWPPGQTASLHDFGS